MRSATPRAAASAQPGAEDGRGAARQAPDFLLGVNLPWLTYGLDFGANAWQPSGGCACADRRERLDALFSRLAASGLTTVRWFVLCDGRAGIEWDRGGLPRGLDHRFFPDLDAAIACARAHGLSLALALFDFPWFMRRRTLDGVPRGGGARLIARAAGRAALAERVVRPILRRYGRDPVVRAWDIVNEPEWATLGYGAINPLGAVMPGTMRAWLREMTALIKDEGGQGATVGLASVIGLGLVRAAGLDFYQVHWYDRRQRRAPLETSVASLELDRPLVLGEFPSVGSRRSPREILDLARSRGYAGAFAWSAAAGDRYSSLESIERAIDPAAPIG
jgi:hypothetical protein